jgi:hypothetical protein
MFTTNPIFDYGTNLCHLRRADFTFTFSTNRDDWDGGTVNSGTRSINGMWLARAEKLRRLPGCRGRCAEKLQNPLGPPSVESLPNDRWCHPTVVVARSLITQKAGGSGGKPFPCVPVFGAECLRTAQVHRPIAETPRSPSTLRHQHLGPRPYKFGEESSTFR